MAFGDYIIRAMWDIGSSGVTHSVIDASIADNSLTIAGDHRRSFLSGTNEFSVAGGSNSGNYLGDGSTFDGTNTIISVHGSSPTSVGTDGSGGTITEPYKYLELEYALLRAVPSEPARKIAGRFGTVKRIAPVTAAAKERYVNSFVIQPHNSEFLTISNSNVDLVQMLYEEAFDGDTEFTVQHLEEHYSGGTARIRRRHYKGYVDMGSDFDLLGSLVSIDNDQPTGAITFTCTADGTFTTLGYLSSGVTLRSRP